MASARAVLPSWRMYTATLRVAVLLITAASSSASAQTEDFIDDDAATRAAERPIDVPRATAPRTLDDPFRDFEPSALALLDRAQLLQRHTELREARPGFGRPIVMMVGGTVAGVLGGLVASAFLPRLFAPEPQFTDDTGFFAQSADTKRTFFEIGEAVGVVAGLVAIAGLVCVASGVVDWVQKVSLRAGYSLQIRAVERAVPVSSAAPRSCEEAADRAGCETLRQRFSEKFGCPLEKVTPAPSRWRWYGWAMKGCGAYAVAETPERELMKTTFRTCEAVGVDERTSCEKEQGIDCWLAYQQARDECTAADTTP